MKKSKEEALDELLKGLSKEDRRTLKVNGMAIHYHLGKIENGMKVIDEQIAEYKKIGIIDPKVESLIEEVALLKKLIK